MGESDGARDGESVGISVGFLVGSSEGTPVGMAVAFKLISVNLEIELIWISIIFQIDFRSSNVLQFRYKPHHKA